MHAAHRSSLTEESPSLTDDAIGATDDSRPQLMAMEGWMQKEGSVFKTWKSRYFRLNGLFLAYYTSEDEVKGLIFLEGAIVRESLRKNMETGFELVCNPSPQSREGALVIDSQGQANYAGSPGLPSSTSGSNGPSTPSSRAASSSVSGSTPSAPAPAGGSADNAERIYYLYLDPTTPPSIALQQRKEWMQTITNNVSYAARLRSWYAEREEQQRRLVEKLKAQVEAVRAEREMERFQALSKAREAEALAAEAALKAKHAEAEKAAASTSAGPGHNRTRSAAATPGSPEFDPLSIDGGASAPLEAAEAQARDEAQRVADATLIGGENLDVPGLIAALKRKNQALEADVRMILTENSALKSTAAKALEQARLEVEDEHAALDERAEELTRMEVAAMEARNKAEAITAANAAQIAQLQAQIAALQASSASAQSAHATGLPPSQSFAVDEILSQAATPHPSNSGGSGMMSASPSFSFGGASAGSGPGSAVASPRVGGGLGATPLSSPNAAAAAAGAGSSPLPDGSAPCRCTCMPPCVPFAAHKNTLRALDGLEGKYASAVMERAASENKQEKLRQEKKVLKQEVIRLRMLLQQATPGAAAATPAAATPAAK